VPNAPQRNPFLPDQTYHFYNRVNNRQAVDTSALEGEIDRLVYDMYGLTEEEIAVVEEGMKNNKKSGRSKNNVHV